MKKRLGSQRFFCSVIFFLGMSLVLSGCLMSMEPANSVYDVSADTPYPSVTFGVKVYAGDVEYSDFYVYGWRGQQLETYSGETLTKSLQDLYDTYPLAIKHPLVASGTAFIEHRLKPANGEEISHTWVILF